MASARVCTKPTDRSPRRTGFKALQPDIQQACATGAAVGVDSPVAAEKAVPGSAQIPELPTQEHANAGACLADRLLADQGQTVPGFAFAEFLGLKADFGWRRHAVKPAPWAIPCLAAGHKRRHGDQLRALLVEFAVVVRVPTVAADQDAQAPGRGIDHVDDIFVARLDKTALIVDRIELALWLAHWQTVGTEHQAGVIQRAMTDMQLALFEIGR